MQGLALGRHQGNHLVTAVSIRHSDPIDQRGGKGFHIGLLLHHIHLDTASVRKGKIAGEGVFLIKTVSPFPFKIGGIDEVHYRHRVDKLNDFLYFSVGMVTHPVVDLRDGGRVVEIGGHHIGAKVLLVALDKVGDDIEILAVPDGVGDLEDAFGVARQEVLQQHLIGLVNFLGGKLGKAEGVLHFEGGIAGGSVPGHPEGRGNAQRRKAEVAIAGMRIQFFQHLKTEVVAGFDHCGLLCSEDDGRGGFGFDMVFFTSCEGEEAQAEGEEKKLGLHTQYFLW